MAASAFLETLQDSALGQSIATSDWLFPALETTHVFGLTVVMGTILIVDLRLLGLASKSESVTGVSKDYLPWTWGAFALALGSGGLLFVSRAADYAEIPAFVAKFVVMALAGLNMAIFHSFTWKRVADWDMGDTATGAKIAGGLSLVLWTAIVFLGRKVGFSL
jgi:hypothetical protein